MVLDLQISLLNKCCLSFEPMSGLGRRALLSQPLLWNTTKSRRYVLFAWADAEAGLAGGGLARAVCLWHRLLLATLPETGCFVHWLAETSVSRCWSSSSLAVRADKDQLRSRR